MFKIEVSSSTWMVFVKDPSGKIVAGVNYAENDFIPSLEAARNAAKTLVNHLNESLKK